MGLLWLDEVAPSKRYAGELQGKTGSCFLAASGKNTHRLSCGKWQGKALNGNYDNITYTIWDFLCKSC